MPAKRLVLAVLVRVLWAVAFVTLAIHAEAGVVFTNLHSFSSTTNGAGPAIGLAQDGVGNFYGTTLNGGMNRGGTVFKITTNGALTILYSFSGGSDGAEPHARLAPGSDGNFYGTTYGGGTSNHGTVFKISSAGTLTSLYSFTGGNDGADPHADLARGSDGNFYGTTPHGGTNGFGTVFKITTNGVLTSLYSFTGSDGADPSAGLVQGSDGSFYGTTQIGGSGTNSFGTVFKINPDGVLTSLYSFTGSDGADPSAGLVQGSDGSFYGTTYRGGTSNRGTVFKISSTGTLTSLYSFSGGDDGGDPSAGLVQGNDGNFYGTTEDGGTNHFGTAFKITTNGVLTSLYSFTGMTAQIPAPDWSRAATAVSMARLISAARTILEPYSKSPPPGR